MSTEIGVGSWLQRRRRAADLTQKELGLEVGCSAAMIRKIEAGRRRPSKQIAALLADYFGIDGGQRDAFVAFARGDGETGFSSTNWGANQVAGRPFYAPTHNIPLQATHFVNRDVELIQLNEFIQDPSVRLVSIVGVGGIGKTRLALAYAEQYVTAVSLSDDAVFDYLYFVDLAPVWEIDLIVIKLAESMGFQLREGRQESRSFEQQIFDYIRDKRMLLIFDNFEHLLDGAILLSVILQQAPEVQILVTSRERLYLKVEQVYEISGLIVPEKGLIPSELTLKKLMEYPAVQLFMETAQRNHLGMEPSGRDDLSNLMQICWLLEGMPLALELAAAWVDRLQLAEIVARISDNLDFLNTNFRDVPDRHRSIRAMIHASWHILSDKEKQVLAQLSVFRGRFDRQAAEEVSGASWKILTQLVNKSLLQVNKDHERFWLHELIRQFSEEKLALEPTVEIGTRNRHSAFYTAFLQQKGEEMKGAGQLLAVQQIGRMLENCTAAWLWAAQQNYFAYISRALDGLCRYYQWQGFYGEGERMCQKVVDLMNNPDSVANKWLKVRVETWQAHFSEVLGHREISKHLLQKSLTLLSNTTMTNQIPVQEQAFVWFQRGFAINLWSKTQQDFSKSLSLYKAVNDQWGIAQALGGFGYQRWIKADYVQAKSYLRQSIAALEKIGDRWSLAEPVRTLALLEKHLGKFDEAERLQRESVDLARQLNDRPGEASSLFSLSYTLGEMGQFSEALAVLKTTIHIFQQLGNIRGVRNYYQALSWIKCLQGYYAESEAIMQKNLGKPGMDSGLIYPQAILTAGMCRLAQGDYDLAATYFQTSVKFNQVHGYERHVLGSLVYLALAVRGQGNKQKARQYLIEALEPILAGKIFSLLQIALPAQALFLVDEGHYPLAIEVYALARKNITLVVNSRFHDDVAGSYVGAAAATLPADVVEAAETRGQSRDLWEAVQEILDELKAKE